MKIKQNKINLRIVASMKTRQELPAGLLFYSVNLKGNIIGKVSRLVLRCLLP